MKSNYIAGIIMFLVAGVAVSDTANSSEPQAGPKPICLLSGYPPLGIKYKVIRTLKVGKHWYGSVNDVIPKMIEQARRVGADAVIEYFGSHRFGFWPWQVVRPVVEGTAITWDSPGQVDCVGIGGTFKTRLDSPLTTESKNNKSYPKDPNSHQGAMELALWYEVKDSQNLDLLQAYIDRYPSGVFVAVAKSKIETLTPDVSEKEN